MTQTPSEGPVIQVKPSADIYTVLLIVAILALAIALGFVLNNLLSPVSEGGYGLTLGELFDPIDEVIQRHQQGQ